MQVLERPERRADDRRDDDLRSGPSRYLRWARTEHPEPVRIAVTALVGPVFLGLLPFAVVGIGPALDRRLGLRPGRRLGIRRPAVGSSIAPIRRLAGGLMTAGGYGLGLWAVNAQLSRGRGTPLPVMPTRELLTDGPFRHCRNPMTLGTILAYLGLAIGRGTVAGALLVAALGGSLLVYLKAFEERELAERFGEPYLAYRASTPFIIPRLRERRTARGR